ncbi:hypothetical protein FIBSPDRAFT_951408 [Athelia psychrophila]|uniref:Uncharacterized protein n=1 Tax=Athelia psychrophila TaxID=1759441 RepID=A0A166MKR2_9AGAM|nr:hypothetical protein FIBSPDRAFT_951408 [Fibularhizoctonia sp. CBS 109695]
MPYSLFLGSALVTQARLAAYPSKSPPPDAPVSTTPSRIPRTRRIVTFFRSIFKSHFRRPVLPRRLRAKTHDARGARKQRPRVPVIINALIHVLAAAVFYYGAGADATTTGPASLFDAHTPARGLVGKPAALLFALVACGRAELVDDRDHSGAKRLGGISAMARFHLVPSLIIAAAGGRSGLNGLLVASQVLQSDVFVRAPVPPFPTSAPPTPPADLETEVVSNEPHNPRNTETAELEGQAEEGVVDYSSGRAATGLGVASAAYLSIPGSFNGASCDLGSTPVLERSSLFLWSLVFLLPFAVASLLELGLFLCWTLLCDVS